MPVPEPERRQTLLFACLSEVPEGGLERHRAPPLFASLCLVPGPEKTTPKPLFAWLFDVPEPEPEGEMDDTRHCLQHPHPHPLLPYSQRVRLLQSSKLKAQIG